MGKAARGGETALLQERRAGSRKKVMPALSIGQNDSVNETCIEAKSQKTRKKKKISKRASLARRVRRGLAGGATNLARDIREQISK